MGLTENKKTSISNTKIKNLYFVFFFIVSILGTITVGAQVTGISSGVTFNWEADQNSVNDAAVLESIIIAGRVYNTFVVPSSYSLERLGPSGHSANSIYLNGSQIVNGSNSSNWNSEALNAFQSMNLNNYFQSNNNGRNICGNESALATANDTQIQSISYSPGIPSNQNGVLAVTERNANNCIHISVYGMPLGGSAVEELGSTFIRPDSARWGEYGNQAPSSGSDYWLSNKVNQNNGTIGIALFQLSQLAPIGSTITEVRFTAATEDVADGKFFIMQEYAVDDIFNTEFNTVFNGDVGANDNVPNNSVYTYLPSTNPINGTVVVNSDGTFTYTPNSGFVGTDVFEVQVCLPAPNQAVCNISTVTMTVNSFAAEDDSYTIEEDAVNNIFNVLANDDFGLDGPAASNALTIDTNASRGNAVVNDNGTPTNPLDDFINYTPDPYYNGNDSFVYQIIDGNGTVASATVNITINNGNKSITLNSNNITVSEDDEFAVVTVTIYGNYQVPPTISYSTSNNTAEGGQDYTITSDTHTFLGNDGEEFNISVPIIDDLIIEDTESFDISVSSSSYNAPVNLAAAVSILDNDGGVGYGVQFDVTQLDIDEDAGTVSLPVSLNANVQEVFTIEFYTTNGTAQNTLDYVGVPQNTQTLTFGGTNNNNQNILIPIIDDIIIEDTEDFQVILTGISTNLVKILDDDTATVNIIDNDGNEGYPTDITLEACDIIPTAETITVTSSCTTTVDFNEEITGQDDGCAVDYTITRTWTFTDCVGNVREHVQVITVEDTTAPTFAGTLPMDTTVSCDNVPVAETLTATDNCDPSITVALDEQITSSSCGSEYTITRTWSAVDCAGNPVSHTQTIIVEDTEAPQFVESLPQSMTVMCNEVPDAAILTALDNCSTNATVSFDETISNNANCADGYTVTRTWSTQDCAGNTNIHTQIINIAPTGPIMASDYEEEIHLICGDTIPEVPELTFSGGCGDYQVDFTEETTSLTDTEDFMITRTWNVTDSCGNIASFEQLIFVMQPQPEDIFIEICVEDDPIDLINYLPASFDTNGVFELISGNVDMEGSIFNPASLEVGEYLISYSSTEGTCKYYAEFTIVVNSDCVPCGRNEIVVSSAVTANGDNINDMFTITGVEYCNYSFEVMIFNRWGDKIFESMDYRNDWGGYAPNNAFGDSGMLPSGTYYYIINVKNTDIEPLNGYIYLGTGEN